MWAAHIELYKIKIIPGIFRENIISLLFSAHLTPRGTKFIIAWSGYQVVVQLKFFTFLLQKLIKNPDELEFYKRTDCNVIGFSTTMQRTRAQKKGRKSSSYFTSRMWWEKALKSTGWVMPFTLHTYTHTLPKLRKWCSSFHKQIPEAVVWT